MKKFLPATLAFAFVLSACSASVVEPEAEEMPAEEPAAEEAAPDENAAVEAEVEVVVE